MRSLRPPAAFPVAPDIDGFRSIMVNYYFVRLGGHEWALIDAGLPVSGRRLLREATRRFGPGRPPRAIILTHGHFDHTGALRRVLRRWPDVPVYAHPAEIPFLTERRAYPAADPTVGGGLLAATSFLFPRRVGPFGRNVLPLPADGSVPALDDWQWLPTPGHSPGHVSLWRERDRTLIAGDAVTTTRQESLLAVLQQRKEVRPPPAFLTPDWDGAYEALLRIRALGPARVASGHGVPVGGHFFRTGLDGLLHNFAEIGLPLQGRYVPSPWMPRLTAAVA